MSSTTDVRRGTPTRPAALTAGELRREPAARHAVSARQAATAKFSPRPWATALQRPAAKILVAGGLTVAGWLLTAALSGNTASAVEHRACPDAPAASTVDQAVKPSVYGKHHKSHREAACAQPSGETSSGEASSDETPAETPTRTETKTAAESAAPSESTKDTETTKTTDATDATDEPAAKTATTTKATSSGGLLGGLVGSVLNVVGGTLSTVGAVTDTLSHTVLAPLTQPPANNPDAAPLLPLDDVLGPLLNGGSNSGGVTVTVPGVVGDTVTQPTTTPAVAETAVETASTSPATRVAVVHLVERQNTLPAEREQPRDSGVHARNGGGDSTPGLPGGTSAPSAPAPTAAPGHDGPGGARHPFAVHTDDVTTTQLKLIGTSLDHEVDGAGREAALPTTSPD